MSNRLLIGRRVAITWAKRSEDALSHRLRELGAEVLEVPAVEIVPLSSSAVRPLDEALHQLDRFDWAIFTSGNAVEQTLARMEACELPVTKLAQLRLAAVGPATAEKLTRTVRPPDLVPAASGAAALAALLEPQVVGRRVLIPRAEQGRTELVDGLVAAGIEVVAPVAYRTVAVAAEDLQELAVLLERHQIDAVVFASPSAVRSVVDALGYRARLLSKPVIAAIGPTTAAAIRAAGFKVGVESSRSSAEALAEAVADRLRRG